MALPPTHLNLNGYTDLPDNKVASIVTFLEMRERPRLLRLPKPPEWHFVSISNDPERYRNLYRRIGEDWLWFSRAVMPEDMLIAVLDHPKVEAIALTDGETDFGLIELDFRKRGEVELVYFGLVPEAVGQGTGRLLIQEAIRRAFKSPIRRFWLHTCSLDHPTALPFYIRAGFKPYKRAIEIADDPRLTGFLPLEAGAHHPTLGKAQTERTRRASARPRKSGL